MPEDMHERLTKPRRDILALLCMVLVIAIPAMLTLRTVHEPPWRERPELNPSPYGYTVSLLLFLFPTIVLAYIHMQRVKPVDHRRALVWSAGVVAVAGFVLDTFFGYSFFVFKNVGATIGVRLPAWDWSALTWVPAYLPVEEFAFYVFGSVCVITLYLWANDEWLRDYDPDAHRARAKEVPKLVNISWASVGLWLGLVALGFVLKRLGPEPSGFPGYYLFIMTLGFLPTFLFIRAVGPFVNWRAFSFAFALLVLVSLIWEATLGVPYEWWNYHDGAMLGIRITAWSSLPIEAVLLWLVIAWDCVIAFEIFRVFFHMERSVGAALLGKRHAVEIV
ncbi:MAG: hypothetical protein ACREN6_13145 [Gemmatimonadaceae bacterium]